MPQVHRRRYCASKAVLLATVAAFVVAGSAVAQTSRSFDIPADDAAAAFQAYARQSGKQVLFPYEAVAGRRTPEIRGQYTDDEALERLTAAAGLVITSDDGRTVTLQPRPQRGDAARPSDQATTVADVVVTGTRIRGANPTAPLRLIGREEIEQTGFSDMGTLIRSLPENFGGGQNPGILAAGGAGGANSSNASTVNLRGLGSDATLVLVNGRRLTGDSYFQGSDISGIPLDAVERLEVLKDGASALYGADAVAGVVNFVLRKDYDGVQLKARLGGATEGGAGEQIYSALAGMSKERWHLLANVEYARNEELTASQRDFTASMYGASRLLQPQTRKSVFVSGGIDLNPDLRVFGDVLIGHRTAGGVTRSGPSSIVYYTPVETPSYAAAIALEADLPRDWRLRATLSAAGSENERKTYADYVSPSSSHVEYRNRNRAAEVSADGPLLSLPTGALRLAVGGGWRQEDYRNLNILRGTVGMEADRDVRYLFVEALIPLVQRSRTRVGLHELELSLSGRYEDYSDFGDTANPHVGIRWSPLERLSLKASWGESFKAPAFLQMHQASIFTIFDMPSCGGNPPGTCIVLSGGNSSLKPETSEQVNVGFDYQPLSDRSMLISASYFVIDYGNRIVNPVAATGRALVDPVFEPFITHNPQQELVKNYYESAQLINNQSGQTYDPTSVLVVVDDRYTNALGWTAEGVDLAYKQSFALPLGEVEAFANATWLSVDRKLSAATVEEVLTGRLNYPSEFKARVGATWWAGGWRGTWSINYLDDSVDDVVVPRARISSWTTLDANVEYRFQATEGWSSGLRMMLSATNLFDKSPPYTLGAARTNVGQYYDSINTSPMGRFVAFQISKSW